MITDTLQQTRKRQVTAYFSSWESPLFAHERKAFWPKLQLRQDSFAFLFPEETWKQSKQDQSDNFVEKASESV